MAGERLSLPHLSLQTAIQAVLPCLTNQQGIVILEVVGKVQPDWWHQQTAATQIDVCCTHGIN